MKHFIAIEWSKPKWWRYVFRIYQIKYNILIYLTDWSISYASTRWKESEVMNVLSSEWFISKKYKWYYNDLINKKIHISYQETFTN